MLATERITRLQRSPSFGDRVSRASFSDQGAHYKAAGRLSHVVSCVKSAELRVRDRSHKSRVAHLNL